ncbi:3-oxoacyl-[acyl-carrier-protein] synthase III C-terminal domain-containing protein [Nocardia noduli]|uniref:3-oxoacyl-[acyl-carrier-protein] synthase III C-terminal domain-containing protein n=1 Tax=Nocardia noduli TaxID=2815722 RepID=UPI001C23212F|nr:3-oxoacyl-[acyl-carrier-protein] synthase III C-terminal domain-containing protein [Nocardia noduli]
METKPQDPAVTIDVVESFFPDRTATVEERAVELELNAAQTHMFRRFQGLDRMHYDPELDFYDLVLPPARRVLEQTDRQSVRYLIHCQGLPRPTTPGHDIAADLAQLLDLEHATAFTLTQQNCAVPLAAVDIAGALLRDHSDPDARALIVAGDKPMSRVEKLLGNTCIVADGSASCLVSLNGTGATVRSFATVSKGEYCDPINMTAVLGKASAEERPRNLLGVMEEAAKTAGYTLDDLQIVIPPNPNLTYWTETVHDEGLRSKFFVDNVPRYSHCLGSDVLINYVTLANEGRFEPGRPSMFIAIGFGMTFSAMVFTPPADKGAR